MKRITLYVPEDQYLLLKSRLALKGKSVSGWFRGRMDRFLKRLDK